MQDASPSAGGVRIVSQPSRYGFVQTLVRLKAAMSDAGLTLFATIDHSAAARDAGLHMPPTKVLLFGNAANGTPLMMAAPSLALELPLRLLVRVDSSGRVLVEHHAMGWLFRDTGLPFAACRALEVAIRRVVEAIEPAPEAEQPATSDIGGATPGARQ
jgi:uncharacterized protein (DUF302 family)